MSLNQHSIAILPPSIPSQLDRLVVGFLPNVANVIGSAAGASVTTAVALKDLPAKYSVIVTPSQDAVAYVSAKTTSGFNVVLSPRLAANTLAVGTFDVIVIG